MERWGGQALNLISTTAPPLLSVLCTEPPREMSFDERVLWPKKKKKKSFGNCWPSLSSLILKMVKQRHREGKSPSKISCHLATGSALSPRSSLVLLEDGGRASLVAQWLRICLLMQGTRVRALVWEDPTCHGAAGPMSHSY